MRVIRMFVSTNVPTLVPVVTQCLDLAAEMESLVQKDECLRLRPLV